MDPILTSILFLFGLLIGSFLNVVILRFDTGKSIARGRSVCFSCGKTLSWYELVPLASFLAQFGRCRGCRTRISWQYPLVELASALSFVAAYRYAFSQYDGGSVVAAFLIVAAALSLYTVIFVYDIRHKIIPDVFSYAAAAAALAFLALEYRTTGALPADYLLAGIAFAAFFFAFWLVSRGTWMGLGDAKLALSMGFFLGLSHAAAAMMLSFWIGAVVSIAILLLSRLRGKGRMGLKSEVPFGPFMIIGFLLSFFLGVDMQSILSFLTL